MWMQRLVEQALHPRELKSKPDTPDPDSYDEYPPSIIGVGCGGAGCRAVQSIHERMIPGLTTIAVDTDRKSLESIRADRHVLIGRSRTNGIGTGGYTDIGKKAAEDASMELTASLGSADLIFILCGLGGGTGSGAAPVIAKIAKACGALVMVFGLWPFSVERARGRVAREAVKNLLSTADSVILLDNNKLLSYLPGLPLDQAFGVMNELMAETIASLVGLYTSEYLDGNPFPYLLEKRGLAVLLAGESRSQHVIESCVRECLSHPLCHIDYRTAKGCIISITGEPHLTLQDAEAIATSITYDLDAHADVLWGARIREDCQGMVRILAIMTGLGVDGPLLPNSF